MVDSIGHNGGLALLQKDECDLTMINYCINHIHASVSASVFVGGKGLITDVYGHLQIDRGVEVGI